MAASTVGLPDNEHFQANPVPLCPEPRMIKKRIDGLLAYMLPPDPLYKRRRLLWSRRYRPEGRCEWPRYNPRLHVGAHQPLRRRVHRYCRLLHTEGRGYFTRLPETSTARAIHHLPPNVLRQFQRMNRTITLPFRHRRKRGFCERQGEGDSVVPSE